MRHSRRAALSALLAALALTVCASGAAGTTPVSAAAAPSGARVTTSFDSDWRFLKGDAQGAERPDFDDAAWRRLDAPHDWSIEGPFDEKNPTGRDGGYLPSGVGWYRKHFRCPPDTPAAASSSSSTA